MTTARQDINFIESIVRADTLELAIEWIRKNLVPEDVFSQEDLEYWATDNEYTKENSDIEEGK